MPAIKTRLTILLILGSQHLFAAVPPVPNTATVTDNFYGTLVEDPYRYFEESENREVAEWSRAAASHAADTLSQLPLRQQVGAIIDEVTDLEGDSIYSIQRLPGETLYYLMRKIGESQPTLYRKGAHAPAEFVFDPKSIAADAKSPSIKYYNVSPNERHLAVCVTSGGSENGILYFVNLDTGETIDGSIDYTRWGDGSWLDDGSGFFYIRLQELGPDTDPQETFQRSTIYFHKLGTPVEDDLAIYGVDVEGAPKVAPAEISSPIIMPGTDWLFVINSTGVSTDYILSFARIDDVLAGKPTWRQFCDREDLIGIRRGASFALSGNKMYFITKKNANNGKLMRIDLDETELSKAETVFVPKSGVVQQLLHAKEGIYIRVLDGGPSRVFLIPHGATNEPVEIELPEAGRVTFHGNEQSDSSLEGFYITMNSWTKPPRHHRIDPKSSKAKPIRLGEQAEPEICSQLVSYQIMVPSHDGVEVPVSIIHRKDLDKETTHPVLLNAYGAYGITIEPRFYPSDAALYELGGIKAIAHVRGGGALGEEWRLAGYQSTKPNTWKDLTAVSKGLVERGLTTPKQIGITGGSAGGITVGRAITEAPDAFGAAVINVGLCDTVRAETAPNGVPNIPEFGSVKTREGFEALFAMSAYHHVKDGTAYPPTLICHGANDTRVPLWHSQKMAARMQTATTGGPVLMRIDYDAGHGSGSAINQINALYGDIVTFVLEHCK